MTGVQTCALPIYRAGDRDFGKLEGDGAGVTHDASPHLDQLELEGCQRPVSHGLWELDAAQEHANRPKPALSHAPGAYHGGFGAYFGLF